MPKYCTECDEKTLNDETSACFVCGETLFSPHTKAERFWFGKGNEEIKTALGTLRKYNAEQREAIIGEALRRDMFNYTQVIKVDDLDMPFLSMIQFTFKWVTATLIALLPFALIAIAVTCAVN